MERVEERVEVRPLLPEMKMEDADNEEKLPFLVRLQPGFWISDRITVTIERGETVHHVR